MRRDHSPLLVKRAAATASRLYARTWVAPQLDALGEGPSFVNPRFFHVNGPRIRIGDRMHCMATRARPITLTVHPDREETSHISIGSYCILLPGTRIQAATSIVVGDNCMFAANSYVTDADWHDLYDRTSAPGSSRPVVLGDNVWVGDSAIVCKGVRIGDNSVVGTGSVVTRDVPPNTVVAGNPARPVKELDPARTPRTRESLFTGEGQDYDAHLRDVEAYLLGGNTFRNWLRSLVLPTRQH